MKRKKNTQFTTANSNHSQILMLAGLVIALVCLTTLCADAQSPSTTKAASTTKEASTKAASTAKAAAPVVRGKTFATADAAADAIIDAAEKFDVAALNAIVGPEGKEIVDSGEPASDKERASAFAAMARQKKAVTVDKANPNRATLTVGPEDWPFPLPIVRTAGKWSFDVRAGKQEILKRRVGENELNAIALCRGYVEAQHEYALKKREGYEVNQYAQRIISTPGKQDGLAWQNADGSWGGPIGENVAKAIQRGYSNRNEPYHGYFFKILKGQGPAAPLGQLDYVVKGAMIGGFALIAAPAEYRVTGVKTFMVSQDGVVWEKDLGPNTLQVAKTIERFNPDNTWHPVQEP
jgi:Protein of unknown function (DUF2950)